MNNSYKIFSGTNSRYLAEEMVDLASKDKIRGDGEEE